MRHRPHHEAPCVEALGRLALRSETLRGVKVRLDRGDNAFGDLILKGEEIHELAVVALGPHLQSRRRIDQLRGYPHALARSSDAAFQDIPDAQLAADLLRVDSLRLDT